MGEEARSPATEGQLGGAHQPQAVLGVAGQLHRDHHWEAIGTTVGQHPMGESGQPVRHLVHVDPGGRAVLRWRLGRR